MVCKLKGWIDKGEHYDVPNLKEDGKGNVMCKLKGWMDKCGHYVEIRGWMQKGAIRCAN